MFTHADKRRIEQADAKRRQERELDELIALMPSQRTSVGTARSDVPSAHINPELIRGSGVVSPPTDARVTRRSAGRAGTGHWYDVTVMDAHKPAMLLRQLGTRGIAPGTESTSDGTPTVRVTHADGTVEIRTAASYRASRRNRGARSTTAPQSKAAHRITAADLAPIGDQNH